MGDGWYTSIDVKLSAAYTDEEVIAEVKASMAIENMPLTTDDVDLLCLYRESQNKDAIRRQLITDYRSVR